MSQEDDDLKLDKPSFWMETRESRLYDLLEKLIERVKVNDQESRHRDEAQQRQSDFILQQQAQFAVGMEQLREAQARAEEKWGGMWERTNAGINALLAAAQLQAHEIEGLVHAQARLVESQAKTDRQMAETTEKLDTLINVVERIVSERQNGG